MELIIIAIIAVVIGYLFAKSRFSKPIDNTASKVGSTSKDVAVKVGSTSKDVVGRATDWWSTSIGKGTSGNEFVAWVNGPGAKNFSDDFKNWLSGLSTQESTDFTRATDKYMSTLGYSLQDLVEGKIENDPARMQVYVEAVVVYSGAYRRSRQVMQPAAAQPEAKAPATETQNTAPSNDKEQAEKATSRRKTGETAETQAAS